MKNSLKIISISLFCFLILTSCMRANDSEDMGMAPDFKLQDLNQQFFSLSSYKDKQAVILFFWTRSCPLCKSALRMLKTIYPELKKEGIVLFAINIADPTYRVKNLAEVYSLNFTILLDGDAQVARDYRLLGVPTYIIVDKEGRIVSKSPYFPHEKYKKLISE